MTNDKKNDAGDRTVAPRRPDDGTAADSTLTEGAGRDSIASGGTPDDTVVGGTADPGVAAISLEEAGLQHDQEDRTSTGGEGGASRVFGVLLIVFLTLVAAGAGAVLGPLVFSREAAAPDLTAIEDRLAALEGRLADVSGLSGDIATLEQETAALQERLGALENAPVATTDGGVATVDLSAITQRVGAIEHGVGALAARVDGGLDQKIASIDGRIAALEEGQGSGAGAGGLDAAQALAATALAGEIEDVRGSLAALSSRLDGLSGDAAEIEDVKTRIAEMGTQLAALDAATADLDALRSDVATLNERATDPRAAFALAVGQLREDVLSGDGYADALATAGSLAPDDAAAQEALSTLRTWEAEGVATRARLADALNAAAYQAVDEARRDAAQGWFDETVAELASIVSVRRTDGEAGGGGADDITARAEARLRQGDLSGAIAEMAALTGAAGEAAAGWLEMARAREAAERAVDSLSARALALVGGAAG